MPGLPKRRQRSRTRRHPVTSRPNVSPNHRTQILMDLNIHPPMPKKKDFRIGILGSGFIVSDCHLVSYRKAGFNPVAIASRSRENAAKVAVRHAIPKVCDSYEQLLDDRSIEV